VFESCLDKYRDAFECVYFAGLMWSSSTVGHLHVAGCRTELHALQGVNSLYIQFTKRWL
jgi:hypothetical protein